VIVACAVAFASAYPDGLEHVAERLSFSSLAVGNGFSIAPMPDYSVPFVHSKFLSGFVAGAIGVAVSFMAIFIPGKLMRLIHRGSTEIRC
jgi:cobalt/nickel transport system permease protein/cobalt/nickel transport protein